MGEVAGKIDMRWRFVAVLFLMVACTSNEQLWTFEGNKRALEKAFQTAPSVSMFGSVLNNAKGNPYKKVANSKEIFLVENTHRIFLNGQTDLSFQDADFECRQHLYTYFGEGIAEKRRSIYCFWFEEEQEVLGYLLNEYVIERTKAGQNK